MTYKSCRTISEVSQEGDTHVPNPPSAVRSLSVGLLPFRDSVSPSLQRKPQLKDGLCPGPELSLQVGI